MTRIHPHVQRRFEAEAEPSLRRVELVAGEPEVEEHAIHSLQTCLAGKAVEIGEIALHQDRWRVEPGQRISPPGHRFGIAIDPEQKPIGLNALEQGAGVPSTSQGGIDEDAARTGLKELYCFL